MNYTSQQIADALDLAVLKPTATAGDVTRACALANKHKIKSVCVAPCNVRLAAGLFDNISAVVGFPHGNSTADAKYYEAVAAIRDGAKELDVVINYGRFLDGELWPVMTELALVVSAAHRSGVLVKAILETCRYTSKQTTEACRICVDAGVDFVKTSTGFGRHGATPDAVQLMLDAVQGKARVKASGGIATYADAARYLDMGCARIGSSKFYELLP
jgi:deoxyribose-phosphate aldolase